MPTAPTPSPGPQRHPLPSPSSPLDRPSPHRALLEELTEKVISGLEEARAQEATAQERQTRAAGGARGSAMDGAVEVVLDSRGLLGSARFGPEVATLTPADLREETLAALRDARSTLGLADVPPAATSALHRREVADTILKLIGKDGAR